jgi:hypothetical protein
MYTIINQIIRTTVHYGSVVLWSFLTFILFFILPNLLLISFLKVIQLEKQGADLQQKLKNYK